jgi:uncharacterized membrane protein
VFQDFWRTELLHPLTVHFPIALLLLATLAKLIAMLPSRINQQSSGFGRTLLLLGVPLAWLAVYSGGLADAVVARQICDPPLLKAHENAANTMSWLFTIAAILDVGGKLAIMASLYKKLLTTSVVTLMVIGCGFLVYAGELGAQLVYQQGAGVEKEICE